MSAASSAPSVVVVDPARRRAWRSAFTTPLGMTGVVLTGIVVILAIAGLLGLTPDNPAHQDVAASLQAPSAAHWFGTDQFGRDIFARVVSGLGNSLRIAVVSVVAAAVVGVALGILAGYYGGVLDRIVGVITNVLFAFPSLLLALALASSLQSSWVTVSIAIAVVYMPIFARVARGPVLRLRTLDYVTASRAIGRGRLSTLIAHILPNMQSIVVVQITLSLSWAILTEAALSFLGFGTPPPAASLGAMVYAAQTLTQAAPWMLYFPGLAIVVFVIGLNLLGDALRTAMDPKARGRR